MVLTSKQKIRVLSYIWFIIACGYHLTDDRIEQLNKYLDDKGATIVDLATLQNTLTYLKMLELQSEQENEADEYLDAFVALGG